MEGQGGDAAYAGGGGRVAWSTGGHALFPAQDEESKISSRLLGDCFGLGGRRVVGMEWWGAGGMMRGMEQVLQADGEQFY